MVDLREREQEWQSVALVIALAAEADNPLCGPQFARPLSGKVERSNYRDKVYNQVFPNINPQPRPNPTPSPLDRLWST